MNHFRERKITPNAYKNVNKQYMNKITNGHHRLQISFKSFWSID